MLIDIIKEMQTTREIAQISSNACVKRCETDRSEGNNFVVTYEVHVHVAKVIKESIFEKTFLNFKTNQYQG